MSWTPAGTEGGEPWDLHTKEAFIEKAARSMTELQANVNNLADVLVFLEVLGYNDADARSVGLSGTYELAQRVFERVDYYDEGSQTPSAQSTDSLVPVASAKRRLIESLSLATPWLGALALLYVFGVSLWMAWGLPLGAVTALMVGVFLGLLISEGPLQAFTRIFMFYHSQGNVSECARALKRSYVALAALLCGSLVVLLSSTFLLGVPWELAGLAAVGTVTISVHRIGYLPIYALKKTTQVVVSYAAALPTLLVVFEFTPGVFPDPVLRYLVSLASALGVLSIFAWYNTKQSLVLQKNRLVGRDAPSFFKPNFINTHTIGSKFGVQFWETLPFYLSGTFFFMLVFSDRVLSWLGNPVKSVGGVVLPLVFNSTYHSAADLALVVLFPVAIVQYVMLSTIHEELHNLSLDLTVDRTAEVDRFIRMRHVKSLAVTISASVAAAIMVAFYARSFFQRMGTSPLSNQIFYIVVMGDLLLAVFVANSSFIVMLNGAKLLAAITMFGALLVCAVGILVLPMGFQFIVYGYLAACVSVALLSTMYLRRLLERPSSLFFARFT
ncbi:MAG TPA: hypothetical protein VGR53_05000 [Nitrososphaerales archaeon]|nr:hypothetical protein [Nitrososphaerales archaeon]